MPQSERFLAVLSHELRTPLTPILAIVAVLEKTPDMPPGVRQMVARIRRNVELESRLIDELLDITRIMQQRVDLRAESVDLNDVIIDAVKAYQREIRKGGFELRIVANADAGVVVGDSKRLRQVVSSLLSNSLKFTPSGGKIEVRSSNPRDGVVSVTVSDSGMGIESSQVNGLFAPFAQGYRPGERSGGLGLGLAISKELIEAHGGRMWGASEGPSRGAVFGFELPLSRYASEVPSERETEDSSTLTILVVEDHPDTAQTLAELLESGGHRTMIANDVASALEIAQEETFDVLVSDIGLPDGTGIELMQKLSEHGPVPAIALSGFSSERDVDRSLRAGFSEHLTKPIGMEQLLDAVQRIASDRNSQSGTREVAMPAVRADAVAAKSR